MGLNLTTKKTVTVTFNPTDNKRYNITFPQFSMRGSCLSFVACFKYLGHMIDNSVHDDSDIKLEMKGLFARANLLNRRFWRCSHDVKLQFFKNILYVFL